MNKLNNRGFAITTILYGILILFIMLFLSILGIMKSYQGALKKLVEDVNGVRNEITYNKQNVISYNDITQKGLYCKEGESNCKYISSVKEVVKIADSYLCGVSSNNPDYALVYTGDCSVSGEVIKFINNGTLYVNASNITVDAFCVGGGGGGGANHANQALGGGGGGGGYTAKSSSVTLNSGTTYNVIIGAGGTGGTKASSSNVPTNGGDGNPSCIYTGSLVSCPDSSSAIIRADGGLGGKRGYSSIPGAGGAGGSGGGAGGKNYGSGNNGGNGGSGGLNGEDNNGSTASGGTGQGGAYQIGLDGVEYAGGGGGGGGYNDKYPGSGGLLGGGKGGYQIYSTYTAAIAGTTNTGGGGGGAGGAGRDGAKGGSGICMIQQRYNQ